MAARTKTMCSRGHAYQKSKDVPVCPVCWPGKYTKSNDFPAGLSAPAIRGLLAAKITTLSKLATYSEADIRALHGIGPGSFPTLRRALKNKHLAFKKARK